MRNLEINCLQKDNVDPELKSLKSQVTDLEINLKFKERNNLTVKPITLTQNLVHILTLG